ncbi:RHS repeat-associated core domain-containing protein, partial [Pseudomonas indica]|uniref:RHS repeat-associated core domain-containing protein n=1 Tax=Pseudomonas indica TaxID=137658 RepID=UPI0020D10817
DGDGLTTDIPLRFPGQLYDAHSALHYNYFRDYDPETGRYVESDPIGLRGGLNTYGYVYGNPLRFIDPFGLECIAFKSEFGDIQYKCNSGSPYPNNWNSGDNSSRDISFNNPRYDQCYKTCMNEEVGGDVALSCVAAGAAATGLFRSERAASVASQLCEYSYQASQCSLRCGGLEEAKSCPVSK